MPLSAASAELKALVLAEALPFLQRFFDKTIVMAEMGRGKVTKDIVNLITRHGGKAVGLTGQDSSFIRAEKLLLESTAEPGKMLDIGLVGDIEKIDPAIIAFLDCRDFIP